MVDIVEVVVFVIKKEVGVFGPVDESCLGGIVDGCEVDPACNCHQQEEW